MKLKYRSFGWWLWNDLQIGLIFSVFGAFGFVMNLRGTIAERVVNGLLGAVIMTACFSVALAAIQTWIDPKLKFRSFIPAVLCHAVAYLAAIVVGFGVGMLLALAVVYRVSPLNREIIGVVRTVMNPAMIGVAFAGMLAIRAFFMLNRKLGPGVFGNWILGRYYRPRSEERVFMFVDLRDSTRLGEQLGDLRFSSMIQMFFNDMSEPVMKTKGEVSHYIGDEAVLTWKRELGLKEANCLRCFFLIRQAVEERREEYLKLFGELPQFKAGAHVGTVVATQVGEIKSEIVYHGDVLNTTARTQGLCNELESDFLVTRALYDLLEPVGDYRVVGKGSHSLKGKEQDVELFAVTPRDPASAG